MLKKLLILIIVLFSIIISSCSFQDTYKIENKQKENQISFIAPVQGKDLEGFKERNLKRDFNSYPDVIENFVTEELALKIAMTLVGDEKFFRNETKYYIDYMENYNAYFVCIMPDNDYQLGGDYNAMISKKNGAILKSWSGE